MTKKIQLEFMHYFRTFKNKKNKVYYNTIMNFNLFPSKFKKILIKNYFCLMF